MSLSGTPPPSLKSSPPPSSVCPSGKRIERHFQSLLTKAAAPYCAASRLALKEVSRHFTLSRRPNGEWSRPCMLGGNMAELLVEGLRRRRIVRTMDEERQNRGNLTAVVAEAGMAARDRAARQWPPLQSCRKILGAASTSERNSKRGGVTNGRAHRMRRRWASRKVI